MFHAQNGLFFERKEDGSVRVIKTYDGRDIRPDNVVLDETLSQASFASVAASMSKTGETSENFYKTLDFLKA
jgi:hypothetical protein